MKYLIISFSVALFALLCLSNANALEIPFTDSHANWNNWEVQAGDLNGTPDFQNGTAIIESGSLIGLTFDVHANTHINQFRNLTAADLFIDSNADNIWDYIVKSLNSTNGTYNVYSISQPLGSYNAGDPENTNYIQALDNKYRTYHPVGLDMNGSTPGGTAELSGWWDSTAQTGDVYTLSWALDPIPLGENFTFAFSVMCANDVVYETLTTMVPEPASILLIGTGVLGLASLRNKKL